VVEGCSPVAGGCPSRGGGCPWRLTGAVFVFIRAFFTANRPCPSPFPPDYQTKPPLSPPACPLTAKKHPFCRPLPYPPGRPPLRPRLARVIETVLNTPFCRVPTHFQRDFRLAGAVPRQFVGYVLRDVCVGLRLHFLPVHLFHPLRRLTAALEALSQCRLYLRRAMLRNGSAPSTFRAGPMGALQNLRPVPVFPHVAFSPRVEIKPRRKRL
jgi:hypothetical protein